MCGISGDLGLTGLGQGLGQALGQLRQAQNVANIGVRGGKHGHMMSVAVSKELRNLIADTTFTDSVPISTGTNVSGITGTAGAGARAASVTNKQNLTATVSSPAGSMPISPCLSLLLLSLLPDFLLVLSLKGSFLYVAPSVRLVLGYEPHELVGRSISDICHPADLVPLMRELKEGSVSGVGATCVLNGEGGTATGIGSNIHPKPVDLLFRAQPKTPMSPPFTQAQSSSTERGDFQHHQTTTQAPSPSPPPPPPSPPPLTDPSLCPTPPPPYVWLECRGRLHVEPGKGRKAIILSGRARWMPVVRWSSIGKAGNVGSLRAGSQGDSSMDAGSIHDTPSSSSAGYGSDPREFWALLSSQGTLLVVSANVRDVLGWGVGEVIGRSIWGMSGESGSGVRELVDAELAKLDTSAVNNTEDPPPTIVTSSLTNTDANPLHVTIYRDTNLGHPSKQSLMSTLLVQMQMNADVSSSFMHPSNTSLFEELDTGGGSSWQYELQQLKFANQRLHEELYALEGANTNTSTGAGTATTTTGSISVFFVVVTPLVVFCAPSGFWLTYTYAASPTTATTDTATLHPINARQHLLFFVTRAEQLAFTGSTFI
ncbi:hypothetical protein BU15DRAFT_78202 [Melanogaster broomeanus]|nr:hypothetical protein BU15DRAFT_78202 [Melanogaster broomeanus]